MKRKKQCVAWVVFDGDGYPMTGRANAREAWEVSDWYNLAWPNDQYDYKARISELKRDGWRCVRMVEAPKKKRTKR